jgi:hypothetical protein
MHAPRQTKFLCAVFLAASSAVATAGPRGSRVSPVSGAPISSVRGPVAAASGSGPLAPSTVAGFPGDVRVTGSAGSVPAGNVFASREDVALAAGPSDPECSIGALPDGDYAFQVTDAASTELLSTDPAQNRTFSIASGVIAGSGAHGDLGTTTSCGSLLVPLSPFARAPQGQGAYKLWVTPLANFQSPDACGTGCYFGFLPGSSQTVDFSVREDSRCLETHCVSGTVYSDDNHNGVRDAGEPGVAGAIVLATDSRGIPTAGIAGPDGSYSICGLVEAKYRITVSVPAGYAQTSPDGDRQIARYVFVRSGSYDVDFCDEDFRRLDFGLAALPGSIAGLKFNDANGNGTLDPGEAGIGGVAIHLADGQGDSIADQTTDSSGAFGFTNLEPGTYVLSETLPDGFVQTVPGGDGKLTVALAPGQALTGLLFGNRQLPIAGAVTGRKFEDVNGNGQRDPGEPGLGGVTIQLTSSLGPATSTVTAADGTFVFTDVLPGTYRASEIVPDGYEQTFPAGDGTVAVTVEPGTTTSGVLFGNHKIPPATGSVSGLVFYDFNKSGKIDAGDHGGLANVTVNLSDLSGNVVATTLTDENGDFRFDHVAPGDYAVQPVPPPKFFQTVPKDNAPILVHVETDQEVAGLVFGLAC